MTSTRKGTSTTTGRKLVVPAIVLTFLFPFRRVCSEPFSSSSRSTQFFNKISTNQDGIILYLAVLFLIMGYFFKLTILDFNWRSIFLFQKAYSPFLFLVPSDYVQVVGIFILLVTYWCFYFVWFEKKDDFLIKKSSFFLAVELLFQLFYPLTMFLFFFTFCFILGPSYQNWNFFWLAWSLNILFFDARKSSLR